MVKRIIPTLMLVLLGFSTQLLADLTATVDRNVVAEGEIVNYTLRSDGLSFGGSPDLSPLQQDFDILNTRQSSQIRMINGRNESWIEWSIALLSKKLGAVTIPSIKHSGDTSNPITIEVRKAAASQQGAPASSPVFMRSSIGRDEVWQNQETILTLKIFLRTQFGDSPNLTPPESTGAIFKILGEDQNEERVIDGVRYQIISRQYVVTPTRAGTLTIPGQVLTGSILEEDPYGGRSMLRMTRSKPFRISSPEMVLKVNPIPDSWPTDKTWLPAEELSISESWSESLSELKAGDSITRTITITAQGSNSAQIPPLPALNISSIRSYPDQPRLDDKRGIRGTIGIRSESVALVPTRSGQFPLPAVEITWFNTRTGRKEVSKLEGQFIDIKAGSVTANALPSAVQPTTQTQSSVLPDFPILSTAPSTMPTTAGNSLIRYWQVATLLFALLWIGTLIAWWRRKNLLPQQNIKTVSSSKSSNTEKAAFQLLQKQCSTNDLSAVEQALVQWGQVTFPEADIYQASTVISKLGHSQLKTGWESLQKTRYRADNNKTLSTTPLIQLLKDARKKYSSATTHAANRATTINP